MRGCVELAKNAFGIVGGDWHLRSSVWGGDRGSAINDLDADLGGANINSNETLLLEAGDIVPRGQVEVAVFWKRPVYHGCKTEEDVINAFAATTVKAWLAAATKLVARPDFSNMLCALSDTGDLTGVSTRGIERLGDCIDNVEVGVDARIVRIGTLRCRRQMNPYTLMHTAIVNMPAVQNHAELGHLLGGGSDHSVASFPLGAVVREIPLGRSSSMQVGLALCPEDATIMDGNVNLHPRMRLCIELAPTGSDAKRQRQAAASAAAAAAAGATGQSQREPILLHVAIRDVARQSYFRATPFTFYPPHTEESFRAQLSVLAKIPPEDLRVSKYVPHSKWPKDRWDPILPWLPEGEDVYSAAAAASVLARTTAASAVAGALLSASISKGKQSSTGGSRHKYKRAGGGKGGTKAQKKKKQQQSKKKAGNKSPRPAKLNVGSLVKNGTLLGVTDLGNGEDDMSSAADRAYAVENEWLHNQRELSKQHGGTFKGGDIGRGMASKTVNFADGKASGSSAPSRRAEPVLRIAVPTFLDTDDGDADGNHGGDDDDGDVEGSDSEKGRKRAGEGPTRGSLVATLEEPAAEGTAAAIGQATEPPAPSMGTAEATDEQVASVASVLGCSHEDARSMLDQGILSYEDVCG